MLLNSKFGLWLLFPERRLHCPNIGVYRVMFEEEGCRVLLHSHIKDGISQLSNFPEGHDVILQVTYRDCERPDYCVPGKVIFELQDLEIRRKWTKPLIVLDPNNETWISFWIEIFGCGEFHPERMSQ